MNDLGDETVERTSRGGGRWLWVWPVVAALVFWWAGWGWGGSGGWWWGHNHSQNSRIEAPRGSRTTETFANAGAQPQTGAGTDASGAKVHSAGGGAQILASQDKAVYIGLHFNGSHIPVQKRVNSKVMWIGEGNPMLAVVEGGGTGAGNNVSQGKDVNADGLVEQAPPANEAKEAWAISDDDATKLEKQGAFIEISQLTLTQNGGGR